MCGPFGVILEGGVDAFLSLCPEGLISNARDVQAEFLLFRRDGVVGKEPKLLDFRSGQPFLLRFSHCVGNFLLDLEEGAGLPRKLHGIEHAAYELAEELALGCDRKVSLDELVKERLLARHGLGADDVRSPDAGTVQRT